MNDGWTSRFRLSPQQDRIFVDDGWILWGVDRLVALLFISDDTLKRIQTATN